MTLDHRLQRLEQQTQPAAPPFRFYVTTNGVTRDPRTGEEWPQAEFSRLCPDARVFTLNIGRANSDLDTDAE